MNSKRNLALIGGLGTILLSVFMLIGAFTIAARYYGLTGLTSAQRATASMMMGLSVSVIVLSIISIMASVLVCMNKWPVAMTVILAAIMSVIAVLEFVIAVRQGGNVSAFGIIYGILSLIFAGIFVAYAFAKDEPARRRQTGHRFDGNLKRHTEASDLFESTDDADNLTATADNDSNDDGFDDIM